MGLWCFGEEDDDDNDDSQKGDMCIHTMCQWRQIIHPHSCAVISYNIGCLDGLK